MNILNISVSPSRTYVALCSKARFYGYYLKKFTLPERYPNNSREATWFFLNRVDLMACIDGCLSFEDYSDLIEVTIN